MTDPTVQQKWCNKGGHFVPITHFHRRTAISSGRVSWCKDCVKPTGEKKERLHQKQREWYYKNKEQLSKHRRERRLRLYDEYRAREAKAAAEINWRADYLKRRDRILAQKKEWYEKAYKENPEWFAARARARRARKKGAPGICTLAQWKDKLAFWGYRCYLCGVSLHGQIIHVEHRKPLSRGGSNWPANLAPSCCRCNPSKGNKTETEYREFLKSNPLPLLN